MVFQKSKFLTFAARSFANAESFCSGQKKKDECYSTSMIVYLNGIDILSDSSSSKLCLSMILAVAGAASRFFSIFAKVITSGNNTFLYLSLSTLTSRLISY